MTDALLHIAIGPVQEFIAAARRTRDLWFGSHLLSEVSKAAAEVIRRSVGATLIFPVPHFDGRDVLCPAPGMFQAQAGELSPVIPCPNKLWAIVPAAAADGIADQARDAAMARWKQFSGRVLNRDEDGNRLIDPGCMPAWREQLDRLLEIFAAWRALIDESDFTFRSARDALTAAVEEAKTLRTFAQWGPPAGSARQSSLDAARYGVLARDAHAQRHGRRYRIASGEVLSAVDLVKRAGGEPEQFVPVTNVALAPWHTYARSVAGRAWADLTSAMRVFAEAAGKDAHGFDRTGHVPRRSLNAGCWAMAYDAQIFLENRARKTLEEAIGPYRDAEPQRRRAARAAEGAITDLLARVGRPPVPYVACLVADGDRLGDVIRTLGREASTAVSEALCRFSVQASHIVDTHFGLPIYAGGDDVLALVPLETVAGCAEALNAAYHDIVGKGLREHAPTASVSFSVGIGIGHVLDALSDLLALGREAEKQAKGNDLPRDDQRRAVAIIMEKRGGQRRRWRARWPEAGDERTPPQRIAAAVGRLLAGALSTRKLFELDDLLRRMKVEPAPVPGTPTEADLRETLVALTTRIISRSEGRGLKGSGATLTPADVGLDFGRHADYEAVHDHLRGWVELHVIARLLADATYGIDIQALPPAGDAS